jgi:hypothetical protein
MRNASGIILRRTGGLGEGLRKISASRALFLAGRALKQETYELLISRQSRDTDFVLCLTHPPVRAQILLPK